MKDEGRRNKDGPLVEPSRFEPPGSDIQGRIHRDCLGMHVGVIMSRAHEWGMCVLSFFLGGLGFLRF